MSAEELLMEFLQLYRHKALQQLVDGALSDLSKRHTETTLNVGEDLLALEFTLKKFANLQKFFHDPLLIEMNKKRGEAREVVKALIAAGWTAPYNDSRVIALSAEAQALYEKLSERYSK